MMKRSILRIAATCGLAAGMALCLMGCGGGGGGGAESGVDLSGTVTAPEGTTITRATTPQPGLLAFLLGTEAEAGTVTGGTPVPGAQVTVKRFDTGEVVGTGQTDNDGHYTIHVPEGIDVVVIATKGNVRLSALVTDVGPQRRRADLTAETTVVAEAFTHAHPLGSASKHAPDLKEEDIVPVLTAAQQHMTDLDPADLDLTVHIGEILPEQFGGGLNWPSGSQVGQALEAIQQAVPTAVSTDVGMAKAMMQQLRDAGTSVGNAFNSELLAQQQVIEQEIIPTFEHTGSPLALLHRTFLEQVHVASTSKQQTAYGSIMDVPDGEYQEQVADPTAGYPYELVRIGDAPTGTIIVHGAAEDPNTAGKTLTVTHTGGEPTPGQAASVTFAVTSSTDSTLDYHGSVSITSDMSMTVSAYFKDAEITTPVTLNGALTFSGVLKSRVGATPQAVFTGSLTSAKLEADAGTWTIKFSDSVPTGQAFWDYPTSWTIKNLSVQTKGASKTMKLTGELSAKFTTLTASSSRATTETVQPVPTEFTFTGTYAGDTVTSFTGTVSATWTNPNLNDEFPVGTVTVSGQTSISGQPDVTVSLQLTTTSDPNQATLSITIDRDTISLTGTATGQFDSNGDLTQATLTVTNESGFQVQVTTTDGGETVTGAVTTPGGVKVADIAVDPDLGQASIHYADGTVESLG